jgi:hypothetical protein
MTLIDQMIISKNLLLILCVKVHVGFATLLLDECKMIHLLWSRSCKETANIYFVVLKISLSNAKMITDNVALSRE